MAKRAIKCVIGIDLGDKHSDLVAIANPSGERSRTQMPTTKTAFAEFFENRQRARIAIEAGTHSPWVTEMLRGFGHEVFVANPRRLKLIYGDTNKHDHADAQKLAELAEFNPELLRPIQTRPAELQADMAAVRARMACVRSRTELVNHVRGVLKSFGHRVRKCSTKAFPDAAKEAMPKELREAVAPLLDCIRAQTESIQRYDRMIDELGGKYESVSRLRKIAGVGPITALAFVLVIGDPLRFKHSRDVGPYLGLVPRRSQSGEFDPQLRITKTGNPMLRAYLVQAAHYVLGRFGPDSDIRRFGLAIARRGGKAAKKRAVVAVARKLAVVMHRLWVTRKPYRPLRDAPLDPDPAEPKVTAA